MISENYISAEDSEQLVQAIDTHWMKYFFPVAAYVFTLFLICVLILLYYQMMTLDSAVWHWILVVFFVIYNMVHHWFFHRILSLVMVDILITNKRVVLFRTSIGIHEIVRDYPLGQIRAVEGKKMGFIHNLFHYGSLWFDTGGTDAIDTGSTIDFVTSPHFVSQLITEQMHHHSVKITSSGSIHLVAGAS